MTEVVGDIWTRYCCPNEFLCITTNSTLNSKKELVMGAGMALKAKERMPWLPARLGTMVQLDGDYHFAIYPNNIIALQTKRHWKDSSPIDLVEASLKALASQMRFFPLFKINSTRPGCGLGGLDWEKQVKPICEEICKGNQWVFWSNI